MPKEKPRKRFHDPGMYDDEYICDLSFEARWLWNGLIDWADDEGFGKANSKTLRSEIFPQDDFPVEKILKLREEIVNIKPDEPLLVIFKVEKNGKTLEYYWLPNWWDYQPKPDYPIPSKTANLLLNIGKLDSRFDLSTHRTFCRKYAKRKQTRQRKALMGLGVRGKGLGVGVRNRIEVGDKNIDSFVDLFKLTCTSLPKVNSITTTRKTKIRLRLKEHPDLEWWKGVFEKTDKIRITDDDGERTWKPHLDWLIKNDTKAVAVAEGQYDKFIKKSSWRDGDSEKK